MSESYRLPIKLYGKGDRIVVRHWSGYHQWDATLLDVNGYNMSALIDLGPQQGVVEVRLNNTKKFRAGTFLKGMKGWSIDIGQLERLRATAREYKKGIPDE
jgi:hypothetical protein